MTARLPELQAAPKSQHAFSKNSGKTRERPRKIVTIPHNRPQLPSTTSYPFRHKSYHPTGKNSHQKNLRCQQNFSERGWLGGGECAAINLHTKLSCKI